MKRTWIRTVQLRVDGLAPALAVVALSFTLGAAAGSLCARSAETGELAASLAPYLTAAENGTLNTALLPLAWRCVRVPLLLFALGFTALGLVGVPAVLAWQGFGLAYSVATFLRLYGLAGYYPALAMFGVTGLALLPALVILGEQSWRTAGRLLCRLRGRARGPIYTGDYWRLCGICVLLAALYLFLERYAVLPLLCRAAEQLSL